MARQRRDPSEYEVGYGKPPVASRFPPGRSGNPRGRPKGSRSIGDTLQAILNQKVAASENGRTRKVAVIEIIVRRLVRDATRGDPAAIKLLLSLADRFRSVDDTAPEPGGFQAEDEAILQRYLGRPSVSEVKNATAAVHAPGSEMTDETIQRGSADEC